MLELSPWRRSSRNGHWRPSDGAPVGQNVVVAGAADVVVVGFRPRSSSGAAGGQPTTTSLRIEWTSLATNPKATPGSESRANRSFAFDCGPDC